MNGIETGDGSRNAVLDRLALALSIFKDYVQIKNGGFLFDSSRLAETLMCDLLSDLCGWGPFSNLNMENPNHAAIDLLSLDGKTGVQVTSTRGIEKVKDAIEKFVALDPKPEKLYIVMLCGRQDSYSEESIGKSLGSSGLDFTVGKNILDLGGLFNIAQSRSEARIGDAVARLEKELGQRACGLLSGFDRTADRVLRILTSHDLPPSSIVQALRVDPGVPRAALTTAHGLHPYLTSETCEAISREFNVPLDWLNGSSERIGEYFDSSRWRSLGNVKSLLRDILDRYGGARFIFVLPDDIENPFQAGNNKPCGYTVCNFDIETPVLVFYEAQGRFSNVFVHLGIQPWCVPHHRKAAIFLGTVLRDLALQSLGNFGARWVLWPRERILATQQECLLSEIADEPVGVPLDETDAVTIVDGQWHFVDCIDWEEEFNDEFVPAVRNLVESARDDGYTESILAQIIAEHAIVQRIPRPVTGTSRLFGAQACELAEMCDVPVWCADAQGLVQKMPVADARKAIAEQMVAEQNDVASLVVFLDVCPAPE
ncbi:SMEK domain-containing protein [Paraburkholderia phymatum]|uniref:SMEK domain-containing protein n=1 Tax=Paraburkholderia phymatum TaxID=148447 RepID=UPI003175DD57